MVGNYTNAVGTGYACACYQACASGGPVREKVPPFREYVPVPAQVLHMHVDELTEQIIDLADRTVDLWLSKLRTYIDADQWPGYAQSPVVWDVPGWMRDDDEEGDS